MVAGSGQRQGAKEMKVNDLQIVQCRPDHIASFCRCGKRGGKVARKVMLLELADPISGRCERETGTATTETLRELSLVAVPSEKAFFQSSSAQFADQYHL